MLKRMRRTQLLLQSGSCDQIGSCFMKIMVEHGGDPLENTVLGHILPQDISPSLQLTRFPLALSKQMAL